MADSRLSAGLKIGAAALIGYGLYKLFKREEVTVSAVVSDAGKIIDVPVKAAETVVKKTGRLIKGSPEAKAKMAAMAARRKPDYAKRAAATRKAHKGHDTKRGLAQDQKLKSSEPHEKAYRKSKKSASIPIVDHPKYAHRYPQAGETHLKIDLPKKSSEKKLMKHLVKEHPSTKGRMKLVPKHQNHSFTKVQPIEKMSEAFDKIKKDLAGYDITCSIDKDKKKITDFRLIKARNLINGRRLNILNWADWVTVNNTINDVLDELDMSANVSTLGGKFKVRQGKTRMTEDDWEELAEENVGSVMSPMTRRDYAPRAE